MVHHHQPYYGHGPQFYCPQPPPFPHQPILSPISPQLPAYYDHRTIQASDAAPIAPWSAPLVNFRPDQSGWYSQVPPSPNVPVINRSAPFSPPGLTRQDSPPQPQPPAPVMSEPPPSEIIIHDFWKGRFAPFPGFSSRPGHLSARQPSRIKITAPTTKKPTKSPLQLLPPKSFMNLPTISPESNSSESEISTTDTQDVFQFDKYADVFIPQYLKDIQKQPHNLYPLPPVPVFPPVSYLHSFLLPKFIQELSAPRAVTILSSPPAADCPPLHIKTYHAHWQALLGWELDNSALEKEKIVLWKVGIKIAIWVDAEFVLAVPGIRENYPRLEIGDLFHLREVIERLQRGSGVAFEGRVTALRKREGLVHLHSPNLKQHVLSMLGPNLKTLDGIYTPNDTLPFLFNISFVANARPSFIMENACATVGAALADPDPSNLARKWLFPEPSDLESPLAMKTVIRPFKDEDWIDKGLNDEQRLAASSIALHQSPVPYLISGPPGTGKTRTVVETVLQILRLQPEASILLCAPSNPATDTLVLRLRTFLQPHEMLRLNDPNRTFAEVPIEITQYCYIENDKFSLPPWKTLMRFRVVVCSCIDAGILAAAQCTNTTLMRMETELTHSLHPHRRPQHQVVPHWTHLLIDEAAQGSEPELLVPISIVYTNAPVEPGLEGEIPTSILSPQIVLCGDPEQRKSSKFSVRTLLMQIISLVGPIVTSDNARTGELDISLLQRLFERPMYADHAHARSKRAPLLLSEVYKFTPFTNLVKNYRSHPAILMPPSAMFYSDSLEPCASNGTVPWAKLSNPDLPMMFFGHEEQEDCVDEATTWFNKGEIDKVVEVILSLLQEAESCSPPLRPSEIGIMAPWREQVWRLRERLRNEKLNAVDVGTVEDYQGRESRVVIISCVRSTARFLDEDKAKGLGLIFEKKRMNVAITRAKELLVVIGNGAILKRDPYWKGFLEFTIRNQLYVGPELELEMQGNYISRLESKYIDTQTIGSEEDRGVVFAGGLARDLLAEN